MLTKMTEDGMTYEDALSQAQAKVLPNQILLMMLTVSMRPIKW